MENRLIKTIEGKYGLIRVYASERQATREEYENLLKFMAESLIRQERCATQ